jgi:hypothetical protein
MQDGKRAIMMRRHVERNISMAEHEVHKHRQKNDEPDREAGRGDAGTGNASVGAVDGIGGAGGSSGTGSTRAKARELGDISGIDAGLSPDDVPAPGSVGKGKAGSRTRQMSDGGLSGKTRGGDSETIPNQESAGQKDDEKRPQS